MKNLSVFIFFLSLGLSKLSAQEFRVFFKDKGSSLEMLEQPQLFLSEKAIARRALQGIAIDKSDLPLASEYLSELKTLGAQNLAHSRWLNYVLISHHDPELIENLAFVDHIEFPKAHQSRLSSTSATGNFDYGFARTHIEMLEGEKLHQRGYTGRGVTIAVIDAGYTGALQAASLDSLFQSGRLLGSYNFISQDTNVYTGQGSHGASVLSTMAALDSGSFVGTAPHANYWLLTSENIGHEKPIEMDHWAMAAEFADSVGAQVINTSLGYTTFDDPQDDYSYSDLDGNTTIVTKAADLAASKGILVVASAGNSGASAWRYLGAPADGDSVLAVGAVNPNEEYAGFSSHGPSFDGRVKPDVVAQGSPSTIINFNGDISIGFGTSFSSPIIAGMAACLVQAQPSKPAYELIKQIRRSAHLYSNPNDTMGYGIPNFDLAFQISQREFAYSDGDVDIYPNPVYDHVVINPKNKTGSWQCQAQIRALDGSLKLDRMISGQQAYRLKTNLAPGFYLLNLRGDLNANLRFIVR